MAQLHYPHPGPPVRPWHNEPENQNCVKRWKKDGQPLPAESSEATMSLARVMASPNQMKLLYHFTMQSPSAQKTGCKTEAQIQGNSLQCEPPISTAVNDWNPSAIQHNAMK